MSEQLALAADEATRLDALEQTIAAGLRTFVEVGEALLEIREGRLYRAGHATFEAYCRERWGFSDRRARHLMDAAGIVQALPTGTVVPANEAQARELAPLRADPERMAEAWAEAVDTSNGKPTASDVRDAVRRHPEVRQIGIPADKQEQIADELDGMAPEDRAISRAKLLGEHGGRERRDELARLAGLPPMPAPAAAPAPGSEPALRAAVGAWDTAAKAIAEALELDRTARSYALNQPQTAAIDSARERAEQVIDA